MPTEKVVNENQGSRAHWYSRGERDQDFTATLNNLINQHPALIVDLRERQQLASLISRVQGNCGQFASIPCLGANQCQGPIVYIYTNIL